MKGFIHIVATLAVVFIGLNFLNPNDSPLGISVENSDVLANAYRDHSSNIQVSGQGAVVRTLSDDRDGDRHQRFILELLSGQTLLIAHNIDLAPRIPSLKSGDSVQFNGEYEWNEHGGIIHWTHHAPNGLHEGGWLKRNGRTYQ